MTDIYPPAPPPTVEVYPPVVIETVEIHDLPRGPAGPQGPPGNGQQFVFTQSTPSTHWPIEHHFGRLAGILVYVDGATVNARVESTNDTAVVIFNIPVAGQALVY